jgi:alkylated DNA repair dioxygenase AlkB
MTTANDSAYPGFVCHLLDDRHRFYSGHLPDGLRCDAERFELLWRLHPEEFHEIQMVGRPVKTPRWQQAYGRDYHYTRQTNRAMPVDPLLAPLLDWVRAAIDPRLNGLLVNWYDGEQGHYIGPHRDSPTDLVVGAPIVTISFGEERTFRLRPYKAKGHQDFPASDGVVFVLPYETNRAWTHEVPSRQGERGRRISVTARAFVEPA